MIFVSNYPSELLIQGSHYNDVIISAMASQITSLTIYLLNRLFGRRSKKTPKLRVTGLCAWNSPATGEFPAQRASNAENVSNWWRHQGNTLKCHDVSTNCAGIAIVIRRSATPCRESANPMASRWYYRKGPTARPLYLARQDDVYVIGIVNNGLRWYYDDCILMLN